jgi:flagellar basal-body rod protein FlgB
MPITDIPALAVLRTKMQWHQQRQRVLAENIANSDTPNFKPRDLVEPKFNSSSPATPGTTAGALALARTDPGHMTAVGGDTTFVDQKSFYETRPAGNSVSMEDEMMKVAANQMDYQAATTLYSKSLGLLKTAIGKR